ncbi:hypothetical protein [Olivibacter sitiensis]|uniref:hypothetical protein n=1 Tax=Olivibacter sitiensis TaxID=376470 RepID=UPI00047F525E|nr:hypothetical protein [Olivibacter sitiensis]
MYIFKQLSLIQKNAINKYMVEGNAYNFLAYEIKVSNQNGIGLYYSEVLGEPVVYYLVNDEDLKLEFQINESAFCKIPDGLNSEAFLPAEMKRFKKSAEDKYRDYTVEDHKIIFG